jgi:DNA transposition AAA+ family ATPase
MSRQKLTKDMLEAAAEKNWTLSQTARHYGVNTSTVSQACGKHGIVLYIHHSTAYKNRMMAEASDEKVKAFSASPKAIQRALENFHRRKW